MKMRLFSTTIILLLFINMLLLLGSIAIGKLKSPQMIVAYSPDRYATGDMTVMRLDTETGTSALSDYPIARQDRFNVHYVNTANTAPCSITLAHHNPRTDAVTIQAYAPLIDSWYAASLQMTHTFREESLSMRGLWSPDGSWLYYEQNGQDFLLDMTTQTTFPLDNVWGRVLEWSPDSRYFLTYTNMTPYHLVIFDTQTTTINQIPMPALRVARWSPDSSHILVVDGWAGTQSRISLIDIDTHTQSYITEFSYFDGLLDVDKVVWSPDGQQIFIVGLQEQRPLDDLTVYTYAIDIETGSVQRLPASQMHWRVPWGPLPSPNGRFVMYLAATDDFPGAATIRIYDTQEQALQDLPHFNVRSNTAIAPVWSPDSQQLLLSNMEQNLLLIDVETRATHIVARYPRSILGWFDDSSRFAYTTGQLSTIFVAQLTANGMSYQPYDLNALAHPLAQLC